MKRIALLFIVSLFTIMANAYSFEENDIYYNITNSSTMTVEVTYKNSNYNTYKTATVIIPNSVQHGEKVYYVTGIGSHAFTACSNLSNVVFNNYITYIGSYAFSGCPAITSFTVPTKVTSIGDYAFAGCFNLTKVTFEDTDQTLWLGSGANAGSKKGLFADCPLSILHCGRPLNYNSGSDYGYSPFANQSLLGEITFGENVKTIPAYMFWGNTKMHTITLPETVTSIGNHGFDGFTGLTSFTIPKHITSIGEYCFARCTGLTSLTIPEQITSIGTGTFYGCTGFTSFVIPKNVMSVGNYAFNGCTVFEESEETLKLGYGSAGSNSSLLGKGLFIDCPLQSVFIGRPLSYSTDLQYGYSPFAYNTTITKAHFGNPVKTIQSYLFYGCKEFSTLEYNADCKPTAIEKYAFAGGCKGLTSIDIPATVTTIGVGAFKDCEKLENIVIKPAVTSIGNYAFNGCTSMTMRRAKRL